MAIFTFLHSWNLYLEPIVFLSSPEKFTLPQALTQFVDAYGGPMWNVQLAAASMTALPVLAVFVIAQKQFVEGLAHTGLKGWPPRPTPTSASTSAAPGGLPSWCRRRHGPASPAGGRGGNVQRHDRRTVLPLLLLRRRLPGGGRLAPGLRGLRAHRLA
ncbi:hypothetical protein [Micromonospora sp. NBC_01412]|uniref:hypothetical protein n=1 Tax=Micromonospora sp. NBC_01412 TaxID=2903590 RepID=UPI003255C5C3